MPDRMSFCVDRDPQRELAQFLLDKPHTGYACFSEDGGALYVPTLWLCPDTVRAVVAGKTLFEQLQGVSLLQREAERARFHSDVWTWCWGDLRVFETGEPIVQRAVFLRGMVASPDLSQVYRYVKQAPRAS